LERLQDSFTDPCPKILIEDPLATLIDLSKGLIESNDPKLLQMWFPDPESTSQSLRPIGRSRSVSVAYFETVAVRPYSQSSFGRFLIILRQISGLPVHQEGGFSDV
jgi:hypothetical protein